MAFFYQLVLCDKKKHRRAQRWRARLLRREPQPARVTCKSARKSDGEAATMLSSWMLAPPARRALLKRPSRREPQLAGAPEPPPPRALSRLPSLPPRRVLPWLPPCLLSSTLLAPSPWRRVRPLAPRRGPGGPSAAARAPARRERAASSRSRSRSGLRRGALRPPRCLREGSLLEQGAALCLGWLCQHLRGGSSPPALGAGCRGQSSNGHGTLKFT